MNLTQDIEVSSGDGLGLSGNNDVYLNGFNIRSTGNAGNTWDHGIICSGKLRVFGPGKIFGFRTGVKAEGDDSELHGVDLSNNRYFGAWLSGHNSKVIGGRVANIRGVTDESYAIAIQFGEDDVGLLQGGLVERVKFEELYRQIGVSSPGEGLAVNFSASSQNCILRDCIAVNSRIEDHTYGVFMGSGGGHSIDGFYVKNFTTPFARAVGTDVVKRIHIHYDPEAVSTPPVDPPPPSGGYGFMLNQLLDSSFGNITGKDIEVEIARAALTNPPGTPTGMKVHLRGGAGEPCTYDELFVRNGTGPETRLKVGGQNSWVVPAQTIVVAEGPFVDNKSGPLVFRFSCTGGSSSDSLAAKSNFANAVTRHRYFGGSWGTIPDYLSGVEKIEVDGF